MRIFIDTNVLISAILYGGSVGRLLGILLSSRHELFISEYVKRELFDKLALNWPDLADGARAVFDDMRLNISSPPSDFQLPEAIEASIRDPKDIPILRAAVFCKADVLLTGDKDLSACSIQTPSIMTPAAMKEYLPQR